MNSGIVIPKVAFSTVTYGTLAPDSFFIGFDLDNGGTLSKIDSLGNITVLEPTPPVDPYQEYKATLTQSSTGAPVDNILKNTLTVSGSWSYVSTGVYYFTSMGTFADSARVEVYIPNMDLLAYTMTNAPFNIKSANVSDANTIMVRTGQAYYLNDTLGGITVPTDGNISSLLADDILFNTPITIRVWPSV
jgi:hypothetical protein